MRRIAMAAMLLLVPACGGGEDEPTCPERVGIYVDPSDQPKLCGSFPISDTQSGRCSAFCYDTEKSYGNAGTPKGCTAPSYFGWGGFVMCFDTPESCVKGCPRPGVEW